MIRQDEQTILRLRELYESFGYSRYKMSRFEEYDLYVQNKDFLDSDEVITFSDRSGRLLALKPDVTLSIIRNVPDQTGEVQKLYYNENVYRIARGDQSFKEILQMGLECIGDLTEYDVAEVVILALKSLAAISDHFLLDISHMGLIHEVLEQSGLSADGIEKALTFLRDKNAHELKALCQAEGIDAQAAQKINALVCCCGTPSEVLSALRSILPGQQKTLDSLERLCRMAERSGFGQYVRLDFSVANDLKYYSGVVFKGYVEGIPSGILSGGQYDRLLQKMGRGSRGVGFAVYADLLTRLNREKAPYDVDTLLLYGPQEDPAQVLAAVEALAERGSVLVRAVPPHNRTWRTLVRLENGMVREDG